MEFVWICKGFPIPSAIFDSQRAQDYVWNCLDLFIVVMGAMDQWVWILMRCKTSGTQYFERICKGKKGDATGIQIYDIRIPVYIYICIYTQLYIYRYNWNVTGIIWAPTNLAPRFQQQTKPPSSCRVVVAQVIRLLFVVMYGRHHSDELGNSLMLFRLLRMLRRCARRCT